MPDYVLVGWLLGASEVSTSYTYSCNYTIFVQALFYNSISCTAPPSADTNSVRLVITCPLASTLLLLGTQETPVAFDRVLRPRGCRTLCFWGVAAQVVPTPKDDSSSR